MFIESISSAECNELTEGNYTRGEESPMSRSYAWPVQRRAGRQVELEVPRVGDESRSRRWELGLESHIMSCFLGHLERREDPGAGLQAG